MLTQKQRKAILRKAELCINPSGNVGDIVLHNGRIYIEVWRYEFGNFVDAGSLMSLLASLQKQKLVSEKTKTMWVGMFTNSHFCFGNPRKLRMWVWCTI